jgi:hypothetical protein
LLGGALFEAKSHVVLDNRLAIVAQGLRLCAPQPEAGAFVELMSAGRGRADAQMDPGNSLHRARVTENRLKKLECDALATMTCDNVHTPEMHLVRGLDVPIAVEAHDTDEVRAKRAEDDRLRRAPKLVTNRLRRGD